MCLNASDSGTRLFGHGVIVFILHEPPWWRTQIRNIFSIFLTSVLALSIQCFIHNWTNVWDGPLWSNRRCMSSIISLVRIPFRDKTIQLIESFGIAAFCHLPCYDNTILMNIRIKSSLLEFFRKAPFFDHKVFLLNVLDP